MKRCCPRRRTIRLSLVVLLASCFLVLADFCTQCGVKLPDGARFCPKCGARSAGATEPAPTPVHTRPVQPPPPPLEEELSPAESGPDILASIPVSRTYPMKKDARGQWQIELGGQVDVREPTFLKLKARFEELMWGKTVEGHHQEYFFEKFLILDRDGTLNFAYSAIRVYEKDGARRMQSKPGTGETAQWHNAVSGKAYELKLADRTITIRETQSES